MDKSMLIEIKDYEHSKQYTICVLGLLLLHAFRISSWEM